MTASLLDLPKEVVDAVVGHLDAADVASLRLLARRFRDLLPWDGSLCLTIDDKWSYSEQFMALAETLPLLRVRHLSIATASCPYAADTLRYPSHARVLAAWARCASWGVHTLLDACAATLESAEVSCDVPLPGLARALAQCPRLQHVCVTLPADAAANGCGGGGGVVYSGSACGLGRSLSSISAGSSSAGDCDGDDCCGGSGDTSGPNAAAVAALAGALLGADLPQLQTVVARLGPDNGAHPCCFGSIWGCEAEEAAAEAAENSEEEEDDDACCPSQPLPVPGAVNAAARALLPPAVVAAAAKRGVAVAVLTPPPPAPSSTSDASEVTAGGFFDDDVEEAAVAAA